MLDAWEVESTLLSRTWHGLEAHVTVEILRLRILSAFSGTLRSIFFVIASHGLNMEKEKPTAMRWVFL